MTELSPLEALAAEYVLGTLDTAERQQVERRRKVESQLDAEITAWEARLAPMAETFPEMSPSPGLLAKIEANLPSAVMGAPLAANDNLASLKRQLARWRAAALGAGALAASLVVGVGVERSANVGTPRNFVAVLQRDAASPAFIVSVDVEARALTVRPVSETTPQGKSYELWLINDKLGAPRSLGVVQKAGFTQAENLKQFSPEIVQSALYAVTLEPEGGSPNGKPSGAALFTGKLIQAAP